MEDYLNKVTFVGIDSHTQKSTAVAINRLEEEKGNLTFENTRQGFNNLNLFLRNFNNENIIVGIEGGGLTRNFLAEAIIGSNHKVFEVNPLFTKQRRGYGTDGNKSDLIDARLIAEILIKKSNLPEITSEDLSPFTQSLVKLVWFWEEITLSGARSKNQLKYLLAQYQIVEDKNLKDTFSFIIREKKKELKKVELLKKTVKIKLDEYLNIQGRNLKTLPGVSTILAAKVIAHSKGISRFSNIQKFVKYAGVAPLERSSGKTKRYVRNTKGNRLLNTTLYMIALNQIRWNPKARGYFEKKIKEGKTKKHALRCLTKRVACIVYGMLKSGEDYTG